ncbi:MAG: hypothetical protein MK212_21810, partial [Saprospiraceae bacterium]|nr:hypothetical protein [Saprospiraceae bacterium]
MCQKLTYILTPIIWILLGQSCTFSENSVEEEKKSPTEYSFEHITLIDTFTNPLEPYEFHQYSMIDFYPSYIGNDTSRIFMEYGNPVELGSFEFFEEEGLFHQSVLTGKMTDNSGLTIYVDTSQFIGKYKIVGSFSYDAKTDDVIWEAKAPFFTRDDQLCYPIFIKNHLSTPVDIGYGVLLYLVLQAKDSNGKWHSLSSLPYTCGVMEPINSFYL